MCWGQVWEGIKDNKITRRVKGEAPGETEKQKGETERETSVESYIVLMKGKNESWT